MTTISQIHEKLMQKIQLMDLIVCNDDYFTDSLKIDAKGSIDEL